MFWFDFHATVFNKIIVLYDSSRQEVKDKCRIIDEMLIRLFQYIVLCF